MWWALLFGLLQPTIMPDQPLSITLTAGSGPVDVHYAGTAGELVTVTARSAAADPIDVTLEILLDEQRIAFDDYQGAALDELTAQDAAVIDLPLAASGEYVLRVNSFNGAQNGAVEVRVQTRPLVDSCQLPSQTIDLRPDAAFTCLLDLRAGERVTLTGRDTSGTLDPILSLYGPDDTLLARNDDHSGVDFALNVLDARISDYAVPADGLYRLRVADFSGAAGMLELAVEIQS